MYIFLIYLSVWLSKWNLTIVMSNKLKSIVIFLSRFVKYSVLRVISSVSQAEVGRYYDNDKVLLVVSYVSICLSWLSWSFSEFYFH